MGAATREVRSWLTNRRDGSGWGRAAHRGGSTASGARLHGRQALVDRHKAAHPHRTKVSPPESLARRPRGETHLSSTLVGLATAGCCCRPTKPATPAATPAELHGSTQRVRVRQRLQPDAQHAHGGLLRTKRSPAHVDGMPSCVCSCPILPCVGWSWMTKGNLAASSSRYYR